MTSAATRRRIEGDRPGRERTRLTLDEVAAMPTADLLTKAYALTHAIDRAHRDTPEALRYRAERDLITAEVLHRTGGQ